MPLSAAQIQAALGLQPPLPARVALHAAEGEREARAAVGDAAYGAAGVGTPARAALDRAEAYFALAAAVPVLNLRATELGGLVRSVGYAESRNDLLSVADVAALQALYRQQARLALVGPFALVADALSAPPAATANRRAVPVYVL